MGPGSLWVPCFGWLYITRLGRIWALRQLAYNWQIESAGLELGDLSRLRPLRQAVTWPKICGGQLRLRIATEKFHYQQQSAYLRRSHLCAERGNLPISTLVVKEKGLLDGRLAAISSNGFAV